MSTPGGAGTIPLYNNCSTPLRVRRTGFSHMVGTPPTPTVRGSGLFVFSNGIPIEIKSLRALVVRPLLPPVWRAQRAQQLGQHCGQHCSNLPCLSHRPLSPRVGAFLPFGSGPSLFAPPDALSH